MHRSRMGRAETAARGGSAAGLVGGAALSVCLLAVNLAGGRDLWAGMKFAGLPFLGQAAAQPGFAAGPVLLGVLSHFAVSVCWAVLFAWLAYGFGWKTTLALGAVWGVVVWAVMYHAVLPLVGAGHVARSAPLAAAVGQHVLFGLAVAAAFIPFQPQRPAKPPEPAESSLAGYAH